MPSREWKFRIQDIIDSIEKAEKYVEGIDLEKFKSNSMIIDAVVRNLEFIGEASSSLPNEITNHHPTIPWNQMKGIRNILIHEYFGVDVEIVWHTTQQQLPPLKKKLKEIIQENNA